jgi:hypothetical protein
MSRFNYLPVALTGALTLGGQIAQASDCSGDSGYYVEDDCPACESAVYRPRIKVVVRRPRITLGGLVPSAAPANVVVQPSTGAGAGAGAAAPAFAPMPVFMMAAPMMAMNPATGAGAGAGASAGMSREEISKIFADELKKAGVGTSAGTTAAEKIGCGSSAGSGTTAATSTTCEDLKRLRKDVDDLTEHINTLTRAVEALVERQGPAVPK